MGTLPSSAPPPRCFGTASPAELGPGADRGLWPQPGQGTLGSLIPSIMWPQSCSRDSKSRGILLWVLALLGFHSLGNISALYIKASICFTLREEFAEYLLWWGKTHSFPEEKILAICSPRRGQWGWCCTGPHSCLVGHTRGTGAGTCLYLAVSPGAGTKPQCLQDIRALKGGLQHPAGSQPADAHPACPGMAEQTPNPRRWMCPP